MFLGKGIPKICSKWVETRLNRLNGVFDYFVGLALTGLSLTLNLFTTNFVPGCPLFQCFPVFYSKYCRILKFIETNCHIGMKLVNFERLSKHLLVQIHQ